MSKKVLSFFLLLIIPAIIFADNVTIASTRKLQTGVHTYAAESKLAAGEWVRISVTNTGIYQITDAELRRMGFSDPAKVGVFGFGGNMLNESFAQDHIDDLPELPVYPRTIRFIISFRKH